MRRRDFFAIAGSAAAGLTLGSLGKNALLGPRIDPSVGGRDHSGIASDRTALSVCGGCSAGCSVRARIYDGRLVGVRGNPLCPLGGGGLCARGASEVEAFYDPDRLLGPVRAARRGKGRWDRVTWDDALADISVRIKALVEAGRGDRVGFVMSSGRGLTASVASRVLADAGSPHVYHTSALRDEASLAASALALGAPRPHGYDLERCDLLLSFGTPVLEGWLSPSYVARAFGEGRRRTEGRLRLIQIGSRVSPTSMRADEWIRCTPGQEPVLALAMAGVLLREGLAESENLASIAGLEDWKDKTGKPHTGFRRVLEYAYSPHAAATATGVQVVDIIRLARTFATAPRPLAIGEQLGGSTGAFGLAAVNLLNALVGGVGRRGGLVYPDVAPMAALGGAPASRAKRLDATPASAIAGTPIWRVLGAMKREGRPAPFDVVFIEDGAALDDVVPGDPAFDLMTEVPLVVSLGTSLDASAALADYVLPATTFFEQATWVECAPAGGFSAVAVARPALEPLVDGRPVAEIMLDLGRRLGGPKLPFRSAAEVVDRQLLGVFKARRGMPYGTDFRRSWLAQMENAGWWTTRHRTEDEFLAAVYEAGGWVDPHVPAGRGAGEPQYAVNGRFHDVVELNSPNFTVPTDEDDWVPHAEPAGVGLGDAGALLLVPVPVGVLRGRGTPNRPSLLEIAAPHLEAAYRPWAELHPRDAERLEIPSGATVQISSPHGHIIASARVTPGVRPGTVAVAWAPGARGRGRYAANWTRDASTLASGVALGPIGARASRGLRVVVRRAEGDPS